MSQRHQIISRKRYNYEAGLIMEGLTNIEAKNAVDLLEIAMSWEPYEYDRIMLPHVVVWAARSSLSVERLLKLRVPENNHIIKLILDTHVNVRVNAIKCVHRKIKAGCSIAFIKRFIRNRASIKIIPWLPVIGVEYKNAFDRYTAIEN
jgi:hypothetical protein